ncbi:succinylglutamate desuccinylase/aspartoacylase family protein [Rhizobium sp. TRM96647]|uniref:succinylglutamate desuccinylase/aspartoacylase domain-containing protein n=1 Tax=unclassified Rhizobium TaxID=2613769 RepID=UPI0021E941E2|nr:MULTISPECIES: succinylglutamate desuccinylase/aspartoacylase family protein [unclassified Rhizobium]MCV3736509.1 succinylglutamate desuccinylase/aspartoacylase family protein [Rhizobium sp. TRM96647]MCV3758878.1 succinylglutamate desuccinylase/aspartoacylase family protein [Rhizobium sp. TRM96650]
MEQSEITIAGDTPGVEWRLPVLRFRGDTETAPRVYLQAALHANELPGTAVLHFLCDRLRTAEAEGALAGDVTIVPQANPIGAAQAHFGEMQGRFDLASRTNFNRDFPLVTLAERNDLLAGLDRETAVKRLKRTLLHMALGAELVLDLHCDDESVQYAYIDEAFWPEAADLAAALSMQAVFLSDGESTAFEEAVGHAFKRQDGSQSAKVPGRLAVTVELRGRRDVHAETARADAGGLFRFLAARGVVRGAEAQVPEFTGPAVPLDNIDMVRALEPGTVLFHKDIGDMVEAGELLATIITRPGFADGAYQMRTERAGLIATRTSDRFVRRGDDLMKIVCENRIRTDRAPGTLED